MDGAFNEGSKNSSGTVKAEMAKHKECCYLHSLKCWKFNKPGMDQTVGAQGCKNLMEWPNSVVHTARHQM